MSGEGGGEEEKRFIILQIALCFLMAEFSFPSLDLENITNRTMKESKYCYRERDSKSIFNCY